MLSKVGLTPSLTFSRYLRSIYYSGTRHYAKYWDVSVKKKKNSCLHGAAILAKEDTQGSVKIVNMYSIY